jgi:hypothetical protein
MPRFLLFFEPILLVVGYALTTKLRLPAVADAIDEAQYQAGLRGRGCITGEDLHTALMYYRIPSEGALRQLFSSHTKDLVFAGR